MIKFQSCFITTIVYLTSPSLAFEWTGTSYTCDCATRETSARLSLTHFQYIEISDSACDIFSPDDPMVHRSMSVDHYSTVIRAQGMHNQNVQHYPVLEQEWNQFHMRPSITRLTEVAKRDPRPGPIVTVAQGIYGSIVFGYGMMYLCQTGRSHKVTHQPSQTVKSGFSIVCETFAIRGTGMAVTHITSNPWIKAALPFRMDTC